MSQSSLMRVAVAMSLLAGAPLAASAQDKPVTWNIGGGVTLPMSDTGDRFDTGYNLVGGLRFNAGETFGVQIEYGYNSMDVKGDLLDVTDFDADHQMQSIDLNLVFHSPDGNAAGFYALAGGGAYYRKVEITRFVGNVAVPICDPWLYICYTDVVPVESILGSRSSWKPGFDVGAGFTIKQLYVEGRYHYVMGDEFTRLDGTTEKANGQYLLFTAGFHF